MNARNYTAYCHSVI